MDFAAERLTCIDHARRKHTLLPQEHDTDVVCPIVNAMHLEDGLEQDDKLLLVQVRESDCPYAQHAPTAQVNTATADSIPDDTELRTLLERHKNTFRAELPAKLPPERNVSHTIPLKNNEPPPPRKSYRLSRPETEEL